MVVVNMAKWLSDFTEDRMYCCPAADDGFLPSYRHYPAKYIGNYVSGDVKYVAVVAACVRLNRTGPDEVLWKFTDISDEDAIAKAEAVRLKTGRNRRPCIVFLQEDLSVTAFPYDMRGGLQSSRVYFDISEIEPIKDVKELAINLRRTSWTNLARWKP